MSDEERRGAALLPDPVPVAARVESAFLARVRELSPGGRAALLLAAASTSGRLDAVAEPDALAEAERAGLVRVADGRVRFRHPLVRAAAYHAATSAERRAAHASLAAALAAADDADEHAWHVAAACPGLDEGVAALLDETAARAERRGSPAAQARALQRAADLTPQRAVRFDRLLRASRAALAAGQATLAQRLLDDASARADTLLERADVAWVRFDIDASAWDEQFAPMLALADAVAPLDPRRAARLTHRAADYLSDACRHDEARTLYERAEALVGGEPQPGLLGVLTGRAYIDIVELRVDDAVTYALRALDAQLIASGDDLDLLPYAAEVLMFAEHPDARQRIDALVERTRRDGVVTGLCYALAVLASWEIRFGSLRPAYAAASEAHALAELVGGWRAIAATTRLANVEALLGRAEDCARHAARVMALALPDNRVFRAGSHKALGTLALGLGDTTTAVAELAQAVALVAPMTNPALPDVETDLAEALIRAGRVEEAAAILDDVEQRARLAGSQRVLRRAARCRLLLARDDAIDGAYAEAAAFDGNTLERARTALAYGERLRRAGRRVEAREHLHAAADAFTDEGAAGWADRARRELAASGARLRRREASDAEELTPQEFEIAALVGAGQDEPRGRGRAVHQPEDRRAAPVPRLPQARDPLEDGARPHARRGRQAVRGAGLEASPSVGPRPAPPGRAPTTRRGPRSPPPVATRAARRRCSGGRTPSRSP